MAAKNIVRTGAALLAALMSLDPAISKGAPGSESYATAISSVPCASLNHDALARMEVALRQGQAFGIPKAAWSDDIVVDVFRARLKACDESTRPPDSFPLSRHFDLLWDELGTRLKEEQAAAERDLEYAQQAKQRQIEQEVRDKKAADEAAERDRKQAKAAQEEAALAQQQADREREAENEAARQAETKRIDEVAREQQAKDEYEDEIRRREAKEQAGRAAYEETVKKAAAARLNNPSCVKADALRKDIENRSGGDVANLVSAIVMASQAGDTSNACKLADGLYRDLDDWRAASTDCNAAEAAQISGMRQSLYTMRKEMSCLGWFE